MDRCLAASVFAFGGEGYIIFYLHDGKGFPVLRVALGVEIAPFIVWAGGTECPQLSAFHGYMDQAPFRWLDFSHLVCQLQANESQMPALDRFCLRDSPQNRHRLCRDEPVSPDHSTDFVIAHRFDDSVFIRHFEEENAIILCLLLPHGFAVDQQFHSSQALGECLPSWQGGRTAIRGPFSSSNATLVYRASPRGLPVRSIRPDPALIQPTSGPKFFA